MYLKGVSAFKSKIFTYKVTPEMYLEYLILYKMSWFLRVTTLTLGISSAPLPIWKFCNLQRTCKLEVEVERLRPQEGKLLLSQEANGLVKPGNNYDDDDDLNFWRANFGVCKQRRLGPDFKHFQTQTLALAYSAHHCRWVNANYDEGAGAFQGPRQTMKS